MFVPRAVTLAFALALPAATAQGDIAVRHLAIAPERLDAFIRTMHSFGGTLMPDDVGGDLWLTSAYSAPMALAFDTQADWDTSVPTDGGLRDPYTQEAFVMGDREDDLEDAAMKWMSRRLKGSDAAASRRGSKLSPKVGWNDGPIVGLRRGPITAEIREDGWRMRVSKPLRSQDGWVARAWIGEEDDRFACAFTIGRSLLRATRR